MNRNRELYLLFPYDGKLVDGYTLIHKHTSINDEPPYVECTFFGVSSSYTLEKSAKINADEDWSKEEHYTFYLIRSSDAKRFVDWMNQTEKDYLDGYYQMQVERSYEGSDKDSHLSNKQIEDICRNERRKRRPRVKYMSSPVNLSLCNI